MIRTLLCRIVNACHITYPTQQHASDLNQGLDPAKYDSPSELAMLPPDTMELTPEDDDLLSYFLSADAAAEQLAQPKTEAGAYPTSSSNATNEFAFAQPVGFNATGSMGTGNGGNVSMMPSMSNAFAGDASMRNATDEDAASSTSAGAMDTDEKRQRRLARNRESARQSRRRKKQYLELLEEKVGTVGLFGCYVRD